MILRSFESMLCALSFVMLCSCNASEQGNEIGQGGMFALTAICNRECNALLLDNHRLLKSEAVTNSGAFDRVFEPQVKKPVSTDSLFILAGVFHKNYTDFMFDVFTEKWMTTGGRMSERIPGDPQMEQQIKEFVVTKEVRPDESGGGNIGGGIIWASIDSDFGDEPTYTIEYRTEECTSITITSSNTLFGREPGSDLSDKFELVPYTCGNRGVYLFESDSKKFLGQMKFEGMSIKDYLSIRPTILPICYYHIAQSPEEVPVETDFTIDIGMANGKHISATTHVSIKD